MPWQLKSRSCIIRGMKKSGSLPTVFLAVLIDLMGFGIVLPLLPFYASLFNASAVTIGLLYSIFSFAQLIFSPLWGELSDRIGRRPVMLISTFGAVLAYSLFGLAHSLWLLFFSRLIAGIMGGNISAAQAYVADVTTHEDRAKGMGLIGAAFGIGFVTGPAISTLLIHPKFLDFFHIDLANRFALPGFFAAGLSAISFLLVWFRLPETVTQAKKDAQRITRPSIFTKTFWVPILDGKKSWAKLFPLLMLSMFLLSFGQASLYSAFPLFCKFELNLSPEQVGILFVFMGVIAIVIQGFLIKPLTKRFGEETLFLVGSSLFTFGFILIPFAQTVPILTAFLSLMSLGASLNGPTLNSLISKEADPHQVGLIMGTSQGIGSLGRVIGPAWSGALYELWFRLPFLLTSALLSLTVFAAIKIKQSIHRKGTSLTEFSQMIPEE